MITIPIDSTQKISLYEQIYQYIKSEITQGHLVFEEKLPSTRSLAAHLSISRNTVDMAYAQLLSEGYIISYPKRGYFVSRVSNLSIYPSSLSSSSYEKKAPEEKLPYTYDFSPFSIDLSHFPYRIWRQLSKSSLEKSELFLMGDSRGDAPLRQAIAHYLHQSRGVTCKEDQIFIGAGVDYLLQLLAQYFGSTSHIALENPCYQRAYHIFLNNKVPTTPIALDNAGMRIEDLEKTACNIAYVTPSHQYPLGIIMPIKRRMELLAWVGKEAGRYIIEDDHDSEFRYKGKPIPSLQSIRSASNIIYIGTFSRAIAPAIRVGYMVLPAGLCEDFNHRFAYLSSTVSRIDQEILTHFLNDGHFERHVNRMRKVYKTKHDFMLSLLKTSNLPITIKGEHAGMHLVVTCNNGRSEEEIKTIARKNSIQLYGLKEHFIQLPASYTPTLLLGYANMSEKQIEEGIKILAATCLS
ncbi:MAG: GntR family transcriptional regulator / MocR family aminotransferase [Clostridiales bacterium]|nr:GntR family transcriptional regulator / MocR family aminotransferase [Clostridiales bacterium]